MKPWLTAVACALSCGCSTTTGRLPLDADMVVTGSVVSARDIILFEGDLAVEATAFVLETGATPGHRIEVVGFAEGCPRRGRPDQTYVVFLDRRGLTLAMAAGDRREDYAGLTDLVITACTPIAREGSFGFE